MATQLDIAKEVGLDVSSVNKILHQGPQAKFRKSTIDKVFCPCQELRLSNSEELYFSMVMHYYH